MSLKYDGLVTCPHRTVDDGGRILCGLIKGGDREVSIQLCRGCPVPQINCQHLRAGMQKRISTPITVRYATGRVEVWDDQAPTMGFKQAACAVKTMPIHTPRDCAGCPLRLAHVIPQTAIQIARQVEAAAPATSLLASPEPRTHIAATRTATQAGSDPPDYSNPGRPQAEAPIVKGTKRVARDRNPGRDAGNNVDAASAVGAVGSIEPSSKIIMFQKWMTDQFNKKERDTAKPRPLPNDDAVQDISYSHPDTSLQEESGYERCVGWTD